MQLLPTGSPASGPIASENAADPVWEIHSVRGNALVALPYPGVVASVRSTPPARILWFAVAVTSLALGATGVFLPVLPTTPFLLLAAYAAARSSTRLHGWLLRHRVFGPLIRDWQAHGAVSRRAKVFASATMAASAAVLFAVGPSVWFAAGVTALTASVAGWLWLRPEPATARSAP